MLMGQPLVYTVIVKDANGCELEKCRPARARILLRKGRARLLCLHPLTIQITATRETRGDGDIKSIKDIA